jgi:galactokinase
MPIVATGSPPDDKLQRLRDDFVRRFSARPQVYQAPGRVNLIGEHTDYNDGFVMPAAIGFHTCVGIAPRADRKLIVRSANFAEEAEFELDDLPSCKAGRWTDYVIAVARMLAAAAVWLPGANLLLAGDVPQGAGLSSSASVEVAVACALSGVAGVSLAPKQLAILCQRAENEFVGARCGIMDQFISVHGRRDHALMLDCRSLESRWLPIPEHVRLVICNSMVKHSVAQGEYNVRRAECESGVRSIAQRFPQVRALRDATLEQLEACALNMPDKIARRCRHVITEDQRVQQAAGALEVHDLPRFGQLMGESHVSMRDDYEISCAEIDLLVELAGRVEGVYGARMTGGGFGGCTVNLVAMEAVEEFKDTVSAGYERVKAIKPDIYVCTAADGAGRVM